MQSKGLGRNLKQETVPRATTKMIKGPPKNHSGIISREMMISANARTVIGLGMTGQLGVGHVAPSLNTKMLRRNTGSHLSEETMSLLWESCFEIRRGAMM